MSGEDQIAGRTCGEDAAAYVLGALEPDEAVEFRRHLAGCAACRKEVAELEQTAGVLPESVVQYAVPKDLRRRVMREVRASPASGSGAARRVHLWRPAVALGAAVVVIAVVVVALASGGSGSRVVQASAGNAELRIDGGRGDLIVRRLPQLPPGRIYEMWVQRGASAPTPTGTLFGVRSNGTAAVGVPGSLGGVSAVLVTQEPAGGTAAPTSAPVIVAHLT